MNTILKSKKHTLPKDSNVVRHFLNSAALYPHNIALIEGEQVITYAELRDEVFQTANYYRSKGIQAGDRVLVFVPMSIDLYRAVLALFHIGATAVFLDEWVDKKRMEYCCELSNCKAFIGSWKARALALFSKPLRQLPIWLKTGKHASFSKKSISLETHPEDVALITFTTGSTGNPKAAKRTHAFLDAQFKALKDKIKPQAEDIALPVLPIVLLCNLGVGATSLITSYPSRKPEKFKPYTTIQDIQDLQINRITASPYFIKRLALYCIQKGIRLESLKQIFTGGAPVFQDEAKLYLKAFPDASIEIVYGSTEAEPISSVNAKDLTLSKNIVDGLLVGQIYKHTQLKIIPVEDRPINYTTQTMLEQMALPAHTIGEIIVAGDHVLKEYLHAPEAWRRSKIVAGETIWHRTGDSGYVDAEGRLYLTGRCKQLIPKVEGGYWAPFLFESMLQQIPEVQIGTLLEVEENLVVFAEQDGTSNLESLKRRIMALLPSSIQHIKFVAKMPRDPRHHSKIDYGKLRLLNG